MSSIRRPTPRGSWFAIGTRLLLTLLTLCLFFEILRLLTFTSATPINHLAQRRDDSGSTDASIYPGVIDTSIHTDDNSERDFGENIKAAFGDLGNSVKSIFNPSGQQKTPVEAVSEYAYNALNHIIPLKELKEAFVKSYGKIAHSDNKKADDDEWVRDQIENVIPELKKKYDEANKSDSGSKHHERDTGLFKGTGNKIRANFVSNGNNVDAVDWVSDYAYDRTYHHIPLDWLKARFEKSHDEMGQRDNQTADNEWINDQIDNVFPQLKQMYDEANQKDSAPEHHGRDAGDKPRPIPGTPEYYTDPSFFPYPISATPNITDELKTSLGDAFNQWRASITGGTNSSCSSGLATCNKADAITPKDDTTPKDKRKEIVEACIKSLIDAPSCLAKYQGRNVLKPYLTELVDKGKIKDEDGKIKKFYKRFIGDLGLPLAPKPVLSQEFQDILATAYKKYKEDVANHSDMSCPSTTENACENSTLTVAPGPDVTNHDERQRLLNKCIVFISWHPNCLQRYETKDFIKPFLQELADSGKIHGYVTPGQTPNLFKALNGVLRDSVLGASKPNSTLTPA